MRKRRSECTKKKRRRRKKRKKRLLLLTNLLYLVLTAFSMEPVTNPQDSEEKELQEKAQRQGMKRKKE